MNLIYMLVESDTRLLFYIGKTNNVSKRYKRHKYDTKAGKMRYHLQNKIRKLWKEGRDFDFEIVEQDLDDNQIDDREKYHIANFKKLGFKLCNIAEGGEEGKGMTPEMQKNAAAKRCGQKRSKATRKKISEARKGMKFSKEHKKRLSIARKKRKITQSTRLKQSKTSKGNINIKKYIIEDPEGNIYVTDKGLTLFCEEHNLQHPNMIKVANGERKHHKGWTIERLIERK